MLPEFRKHTQVFIHYFFQKRDRVDDKKKWNKSEKNNDKNNKIKVFKYQKVHLSFIFEEEFNQEYL